MINIISPINQLGYGLTGLNIVKALSKIEDVALWPISQPQITTQADANIISQAIKNNQFFDYEAPCVRIWHQHDMAQFVGRGTKIGFPIFELDLFSELEKHNLSFLDKIFVCSSWAKSIILKNINIAEKNVNVIPLGVDSSIFKPCAVNNDGPTVFYNCGKWEVRKGHDLLVKLFNDAFSEEDDVQLWLMCENPFLSEEEAKNWQNLYYGSKLGSKIRIFSRMHTQEQVYNIMSQVDCGIFPSRAEGWNLELLELMSCGKTVITTNYSAHTEFCNQENAMLVDINTVEKAVDNKWFFGQGNWAKISDTEITTFINHMRQVHDKKKNNQLTCNTNGVETAKKFTWQNTAREIIKHV
jgi:glycosyltransferase involved in cell wall biosynthesis